MDILRFNHINEVKSYKNDIGIKRISEDKDDQFSPMSRTVKY